MQIPFKRNYYTGKELLFLQEAMQTHHLQGDGIFAERCQSFFRSKYGFSHNFLTSSCTDALEICALLLNIQPGDEIIAPAYTFVSTANAFVLRGATIRFADSQPHHPNISVESVEKLITPRTRAIVVVHYAGCAADMDAFVSLAKAHNVFLIEDAAQAIHAFYKERPLGTFGDLATFSFHDTKNISCGEGGLLVINNPCLVERAQIIREKGTNRAAFLQGVIQKYEWIDVGSSFVASELSAAFLWAQLQEIENITFQRLQNWYDYYATLQPISASLNICLPHISSYMKHNGNIFYILCQNIGHRNKLMQHLKRHGVETAFHYTALHQSPFYLKNYPKVDLLQAERFADCLLRLPLYPSLTKQEIEYVVQSIISFSP